MPNEIQTVATEKMPEPVKHLKSCLANPAILAELQKALPKYLTAEKLLSVALTAVMKTPDLARCSTASILQAVKEAGQLGLVTDGVLGDAHLVPFKSGKTGESYCTLIPGYRGLRKLAIRSGRIATIEARCVHVGDAFEYCEGLHPDLKHTPSRTGERNWETFIGVYARATLTTGEKLFRYLPKAEVLAHKAMSKAQAAAWASHPLSMAEKTAIRVLCTHDLVLGDEVTLLGMREEYLEAGVLDPDQAVTTPLTPGRHTFGFKKKALPQGTAPMVETQRDGVPDATPSLPPSKTAPPTGAVTPAPAPGERSQEKPPTKREPFDAEELPPDQEIGGLF